MKRHIRKAWSISLTVAVHALAATVLTVIVSLPAGDLSWSAQALHAASGVGFEVDWVKMALHFGIGCCAWALIVILYMLVQIRRKEAKKKVTLKPTTGTVVTETLIVFPFILLLISGLAQLAMLNLTGMLADLAAFNGARAAWVWLPERDAPRSSLVINGGKYENVKDQARIASAAALAPTAPNDIILTRPTADGSSPRMRHQRAIVVGSFMPDNTSGVAAFMWSGGAPSLAPGGAFGLTAGEVSASPLAADFNFSQALDHSGFRFRAARKITFAEWHLWPDYEVIDSGGEVGVEFTYYYSMMFPWFQYLWGTYTSLPGSTPAYYALIRRRHTFAKQPDM